MMSKLMMRQSIVVLTWSIVFVLIFTSCSRLQEQTTASKQVPDAEAVVQKVNQPPVDPVVTRKGTEVFIELTAQITDIEISKGVIYNAWTFNGLAPGPILRVKEGDMLHVTL